MAEKKKVVIIGAGVAGLSAGCYLRMNGFETEIYEMHSRAGGLCTNWQRGEFTFNGCVHWLLGSNDSNPFFSLWSELFDISSIQFITHSEKMTIETLVNRDRYGNNWFHLYTEVNRLENYLLDIAPEDEKVIRSFIKQIRRIQQYEIPPLIKSVPQLMPWYKKLAYIRHLPLLLFLNKFRKITNFSLAAKMKNPFLKEAFRLLYDGSELPLLIHIIPLAFQDKKGAGYPIGGSDVLVKKLVERYHKLGGKLSLNAPVERIMVEMDSVKGILLKNGKEVPSDFVISTADWKFTVFNALGGKYSDKTILSLATEEKLKVYYSIFFLFLGLNRTFDEFPHLYRFPLELPITSPDSTTYERLEIHIYSYDPTFAPPGKSVLSVNLYTRNGDFWIRLRGEDKEGYEKTKNDLANMIIDHLEKKIGNIREHIEQMDVATPATFHRYTNNWHGSIQGWLPGKNMVAPTPVKQTLPGLKNFYLAGQWVIPGGGLPVAIKTARDAAMLICAETNEPFTVKPL